MKVFPVVRNTLALAIALLTIATLPTSAWPAQTIEVRDELSGFTVRLPEGFVPLPRTRKDLRMFVRRATGRQPVMLTLQTLDGPVARDVLTPAQARAVIQQVIPGAEVTLERAYTMGVEVPVVMARSPGREISAVITLPTIPRAVRLTVTAGPDDADEVRNTARTVLRTLRARTNWLTREEIARRHLARWMLGVAWGLVALYAVGWLVRFRHRPVRWQAALLAAGGTVFFTASALLASVPRGASAFEPVTPALVGLVCWINAALQWTREGKKHP